MLQYRYRTSGISISSEIEIPELRVCDTTGDISIYRGSIPATFPYVIDKGYYKAVSGDEFLFEVKTVARFLVKGRSEVVVEPGVSGDDALIRLYLLSSIMSVLMYRRGMLPLHASSIIAEGRAFLFCAESGSGKSTLALGLQKRGYEVLNDDINAVSLEQEKALVSGGYTHLKLGDESLQAYAMDASHYRRLPDEKKKYSVPTNESAQLSELSIDTVFFLEVGEYDQISHENVNGIEAFSLLRGHSFRNNFINELGKAQAHFEQCCRLARLVQLVRIYRPRNVPHDEFVDYVERLIKVKPVA